MTSVSNRVAVITGAASGIGEALAYELARRGCALALCDTDQPRLDRVADRLRLIASRRLTAHLVDVADRAAMYDWANTVSDMHGGCDLLFNNAGIGLGAMLDDIDWAKFHRVMDVNFWGAVHGTRAFLPLMRRSTQGHIVNIASVLACVATPAQGSYVASKFALRGYSETLAQEFYLQQQKLNVTCVLPSGVATRIARNTPLEVPLAAFPELSAERIRQAFIRLQASVSPQRAAFRILRAVERNRRRLLIGRDAHVLDFLQRLMPQSHQDLVAQKSVSRIRRLAGDS